MVQSLQSCDSYLLSYLLGFISLGDGVFQFGSSCKLAKALLGYAYTWRQLSFQPCPCTCQALCTQHIMTCYCMGKRRRQFMMLAPPKVLLMQPFMRMFTREIDHEHGFIVWKLIGCDTTAVSLHLNFRAATKRASLVVGWCSTTVTDNIISAAMTGYAQSGSIWQADFYKDRTVWLAKGRTLRSAQMPSVPGTLGFAMLHVTAQPGELALFTETGVVNKARVPTALRFDPSLARTLFVMYVANDVGTRRRSSMKHVARHAFVECRLPSTVEGYCYRDVLRKFL